MTIHNYWWLLIWAFLFGGICFAFIPKQEEYVLGKREVRWNWLPALILITPYVLWAAGRSNFGDSEVYRSRFFNVPSGISQIWVYTRNASKDKGFALLEVLFKTLISHSDVAFFSLVAAIQLLCLAHIYRKYSRNYWLSMFLFVASTDYLSWMHNGMRQFLAVALIFAALPLLVKKRYVPMVLVVVIASQIHLTALIFLPFIFIVNGRAWNIRTLGFIVALILSILFLDRMTGFMTNAMEDTAYEGNIDLLVHDDGTNIFRVLFYSVPAIMTWIFRPYIDKADEPLINVCSNLSIVAAGFYVLSFFTSGLIVGRIPIYFSLANYILIPWLITEIFDSGSAVLMDVGFVGVYTVFFYIQGQHWKIL